MNKNVKLEDAYFFSDFRPTKQITVHPHKEHTLILNLKRSKKKHDAHPVVNITTHITTVILKALEIYRLESNKFIWRFQ